MTSAFVVSAIVLIGTLVSLEAGFRWGRRDTLRVAHPHEGISAVETAAFALLGLLLALSFAGATTRLEAKREVIVAEANAIGTAYRRLDVLPPDAQPPIRQQFRRLIDARISAYERRFDPARVDRDLSAVSDAQHEIWSLVVVATASRTELALVVLPPINEMMDVSTARSVALRAHLPTLIVVLLVAGSILSGVLAGYGMAKRGHRSWLHGILYAAMLAMTVFTVIDLDHPRFGLINIEVAYQPLIELREAMKPAAPR
jgi:ABC-type glycerol-3-phosphate transport system permease component